MSSLRNPNERRRPPSNCCHHKKLLQIVKNKIRFTILTEFFSQFITPPWFMRSMKNKDKAEEVWTKLLVPPRGQDFLLCKPKCRGALQN
jgi:hypothetical protein